MKKNVPLFSLKCFLTAFYLLSFSVDCVFSQQEKISESQVQVVGGPRGSFNSKLVGQYAIESREKSVVVYVILEEFDNQNSLAYKVDSMVINSFLVYQGKNVKFDLMSNTIGDRFGIGVSRKDANMLLRPLLIREGETLKHKVYLPSSQDLMKKIPMALIYADVNDKALRTILEDENKKLDPSMKSNDKKMIYDKLSHYYIAYYQLKLIGQ